MTLTNLLDEVKQRLAAEIIDRSGNGECPFCHFDIAQRHSYNCTFKRLGTSEIEKLIEIVEVQRAALDGIYECLDEEIRVAICLAHEAREECDKIANGE